MRVKFTHPKVADKFVLFDVPDELPPIWLIAFPINMVPEMFKEGVTPLIAPKRVAVFHRRTKYREDRYGKIEPLEYVYEFFQWQHLRGEAI